jgi:hypothetical protein
MAEAHISQAGIEPVLAGLSRAGHRTGMLIRIEVEGYPFALLPEDRPEVRGHLGRITDLEVEIARHAIGPGGRRRPSLDADQDGPMDFLQSTDDALE